MSLRIWLPLTKDLKNQGLDDVTVNGGTIDNNGKLGKCYLVTKTSPIVITQSISATSEWTINFWVKLPSSMNNATAWETMFSFPTINADTGANSISNISWASYHNIKIWDDANHQWFWAAPSTHFNYDKWHMWTVAHTANGSGVTGKIYIDGNLIGTYNNTTHQMKIRSGSITIGGGISTGGFYINDFRLYDHCLSPMEIKELSKGLVLHYPLSDSYMEATTNLITTEDCLSSTCYNGVTGKYGYGTNTDIYKIVTTYDGRKGTKVYMGTNGNGTFPYIYIDNMFTSDGTNSPAYKTLSFDYYTNIGTSIRPYRLGNGSGTATYRITNKNGVATGTGTDAVSIPVVTNGWNHIEITFHGTAAADSQWGYIQNSPSHTSNTNNFWFFANMQLETKDHATGYAGIGGTRNSNMIYDCSGFCNNGTISGALTISNDTPKYNVSTVFNGVDNCIQIGNWYSLFQNPFTINMWFKKDEIGSKGYETLFGGASGFEIDTRAGNSQTLSLYLPSPRGVHAYSPFNLNQWYMVTMVSDGINEEFYVDGILRKTIEKKAMTNSVYRIGAWNSDTSQNFKGQISDFRIYATALSADDVKSLYQNSAYIDNQGNIYGAVYEEV